MSIFVGGGEALFYLPPPAVDFRSPIGSLGYSPALAWAAITNTMDGGDDRNVFPTVLEAGPRSRPWQIWSLVWACLLVHRWLSSCCALTWWEGWGSLCGLFHKSTNPIYGLCPQDPLTFQRPFLLILSQGVRFQHTNLGGTQTSRPYHSTQLSFIPLKCGELPV